MDWKLESTMFDQAASYYDKYRPSYPKEIIDALIQKTGIDSNSKFLEIGAGSGKATELFASHGYDILCVDPGAQLVEVGRKRFANFDNIKFEVSRFEEYPVAAATFDVIFSAQAFHWIPQPIGFQKCAKALKDGGYLALLWNMYITYDNEIDNELLEISHRYGGIADFLSESDCEKRIASITAQIENSGLFSHPQVHRLLWKQSYYPNEYFGFMLTGNSFIQKTKDEKERAYEDILNLSQNNNGKIERPYLCVLYLAQKIQNK